MKPFIQVRRLTVIAAGPLLHEVSFTAAKGEILGLVGASGSGKSLTCLSILGLLPAGLNASGSIEVCGEQMPLSGKDARRARGRRLAMIMQNPMSCFDPVFTIATHFRETLDPYPELRPINNPAHWAQALAEVGFPHPAQVLDLYPFQMSGGMLQRVMIALALVQQNDFLLADEATTDLDTVSQSGILDALESLVSRRGLGVLLITHDLSVIARLADRVLVMTEGSVVECGSVADIFHRSRHPYTASLLAAHHRLYGPTPAAPGCTAMGSGLPGTRG